MNRLYSLLLLFLSVDLLAGTNPCTAPGNTANPDNTKCDTFYSCQPTGRGGFIATLQRCPWPLVWDNTNNFCNKRTRTSCLAPNTPCAYGGTAVQDSGDCSHFFLCSNGVGALMYCPSGLAFNPAGYCDWPANVDCSHTFCYSEPTTAYTYFDYAAGVICNGSNEWITQKYPYDGTGRTAAMCFHGDPILIYCCGQKKNVIGSYSACQNAV